MLRAVKSGPLAVVPRRRAIPVVARLGVPPIWRSRGALAAPVGRVRTAKCQWFLRQHPGVLAMLGEGARVCSPHDRAVERDLRKLDRQALNELRVLCQGALEPAIRAATKRDAAFSGAANIPKILRILSGEIWEGKLDWEAKQFQRALRDQNIDSLMGRHALGLIHGNRGLFSLLNPEELPIEIEPSPKVDLAGPIEQRYAMLEACVALLRVGYDEREIRSFADESLRAVGPDPQAAIRFFLGRAHLRIAHRERHAVELAVRFDEHEAKRIALRLSRVRWIEAQIPPQDSEYREDLERLLALGGREEILEELDRRFEAAMETALRHDPTASLAFLQTVRFSRVPADRAKLGAIAHAEAETLPEDHANWARLDDLTRRIEAGEASAIGGADYATQTFPLELLREVARGAITCVVYDGSAKEALEYVRDRYGTEHGRRCEVRLIGLQGLYGSYPRQLVTLSDGRHFLILAGFGESRQLNNAASLLWVEDEQHRRVPRDQLVLARSPRDLQDRLHTDLSRALEHDFAADPRGLARIDDIPTRLLIVQNPAHLQQAYGERFTFGADPIDPALPFRIGYLRHESGSIERAIVPKVGGGGLYGDSAGAFVKAFFSLGLERLNPNVIFSGTAGGFTGNGLPAIEPGALIVPTSGIGSLESDEVLPLVTLATDRRLRDALARSGAHLSKTHVAVPAPAVETFPLIHELVGRGFSSVDVEGWSILKAVHELRRSNPRITFTPIYHHSDDPRASEHDRYQNLAMTGPLFEGARFPEKLYGLIEALVDVTSATLTARAAAASGERGSRRPRR